MPKAPSALGHACTREKRAFHSPDPTTSPTLQRTRLLRQTHEPVASRRLCRSSAPPVWSQGRRKKTNGPTRCAGPFTAPGRSALGRSRTFNLRIKSPLLCQLSYECEKKMDQNAQQEGCLTTIRATISEPTTAGRRTPAFREVARQEGLEPPTHSLEGCRSIQLSYWRNCRIGAPPAERR